MDDLLDKILSESPESSDCQITTSVLESLYSATKAGYNLFLSSTLSNIKNLKIYKVLVNVAFPENDGQNYTLLGIAAIHNHILIVKTLINNYLVDLEALCDVSFDDNLVRGATALWCAACVGNIDVCKLLIKKGALVNHQTEAKSTPLRAACFQGRCDIVEYLIKSGADVNLANAFNNTALMMSSYRGNEDIVQILLKSGANPNRQALCGATALHYAAEVGHVEICKLLLEHGAKLLKNEFGMDAVTVAAERVQEALVDFFIQRENFLTKQQKVDTYELLGSSFANEKDRHNIEKSHKYLMFAMMLRYEDPDNVIRKPLIEPVPAYENWVECQTIPDLKAIRLNHNSIHMESLTIRERLLGIKYPDLTTHVIYRGAVLADQGRFDRCEGLWTHVLYLRQANGSSIHRDLLRFAQLYAQMYLQNQNLNIDGMLEVLKHTLIEYEINVEKLKAEPKQNSDFEYILDFNDQNISTTLYIISILTKVLSNENFNFTRKDLENMYLVVSNIVKQDVRTSRGETLLHLAVNGLKPIDQFHIDEVCRYPCPQTTDLLLHCGASVRAVDCERDTPLHTLAISNRDVEDYDRDITLLPKAMKKIFNQFLKYGVHLDSVNNSGLKACNLSPINDIYELVRQEEKKHLNLQCITSRYIGEYKIKYKGAIPKHLEAFVEMHCPKLSPETEDTVFYDA